MACRRVCELRIIEILCHQCRPNMLASTMLQGRFGSWMDLNSSAQKCICPGFVMAQEKTLYAITVFALWACAHLYQITCSIWVQLCIIETRIPANKALPLKLK